MDFEQFLDKDILNFLDSKIEHKGKNLIDREEEYGLYISKDYVKELNTALDNDELTKAKRLFDELKDDYNKLPKNSLERKKIYVVLEQMFAKIEAYVKMHDHHSESVPISLKLSTVALDTGIKQHMSKLEMQSAIIEQQTASLAVEPKASTVKQMTNTTESSEPIVSSKIPPLTTTFTENKETMQIIEKIMKQKPEVTAINPVKEKPAITKPSTKMKSEADKPMIQEAPKPSIIKEPYQKPIVHAEKHEDKKLETPSSGSPQKSSVTGEKGIEIYKIPKIRTNTYSGKHDEIVKKTGGHEPTLMNDAAHNERIIAPNKDDHIKDDKATIGSGMSIGGMQLPVRIDKDNSVSVNEQLQTNKTAYTGGINSKSDNTELFRGRPDDTSTVDSLYFHGVSLLYNHRYHEAYKFFEEVLAVRPRSKAAKIRMQECVEAISSG